MNWANLFFDLFAVIAVVLALITITRRNAMHSAIALMMAFIAFAAVYIILGAELLAAIQVLVYAGGVMALMIFVIMSVKSDEQGQVKQTHAQTLIAAFIGVLFVVEVGITTWMGFLYKNTGALAKSQLAAMGNTEALGTVLFTKFLFPFEVASVLLLAAMVGAIVLAKYKLER